jgi:hypothetical protein
MSSKKTTGFHFGLSVEKILDNSPEQQKKQEVILQNNEGVRTRSKPSRNTALGQLTSQGSHSYRSKETLGPITVPDAHGDTVERMHEMLRMRSQTVLSVIKERKKMTREQAD